MPLRCCLLTMVLLATGLLGCVDEKCFSNTDCPANQVCLQNVGRCIDKQCRETTDCPPGQVCDEELCVPGCRTDAECGSDQTCFENHCVSTSAGCECPRSPEFCATDMNQFSATAKQTVCVGDKHGATALFFGSVSCSHCRTLFLDLLSMKAGIEAEQGESLRLMFVQLKEVETSEFGVRARLGEVDAQVVQARPDLDIWDQYSADWYDLVLVDSSGCLAEHYGPLSSADLYGPLADEIATAWVAAGHADCQPIIAEPAVEEADVSDADSLTPDVDAAVDGGEGVFDIVDIEVSTETSEVDLVTSDVDIATETDATAETDATVDADSSEGVDVPADQGELPLDTELELADVEADVVEPWRCEVPDPTPRQIGQLGPEFSCEDRNPSSPTAGAYVTDVSLRQLVWIAYFASCT